MRRVRSVLLLIVLFVIAAALQWWRTPAPGEPETVDEVFAFCGEGGAFACVSDGDSFRLGTRKIRIRGIDAPETGDKAQCDAERVKAEAARAALRDWLNRGPFEMRAKPGDARDQYGRDLRIVSRAGQTVDEEMIASGLAHKYVNHKTSWCVSRSPKDKE